MLEQQRPRNSVSQCVAKGAADTSHAVVGNAAILTCSRALRTWPTVPEHEPSGTEKAIVVTAHNEGGRGASNDRDNRRGNKGVKILDMHYIRLKVVKFLRELRSYRPRPDSGEESL